MLSKRNLSELRKGWEAAGRCPENTTSIKAAIETLQQNARRTNDAKKSVAMLETAEAIIQDMPLFVPEGNREAAKIHRSLLLGNLHCLVEACTKLEDWDSAIRYCTRCLAIAKDDLSPEGIVPIRLQMCALLGKVSRHEAAIRHAHEAATVMQSEILPKFPTTANHAYLIAARYNEATQLMHLGRHAEARPLIIEIVGNAKTHLPPTHPLLKRVYALANMKETPPEMAPLIPPPKPHGGGPMQSPHPPPTAPVTKKHTRKKHTGSPSEEKPTCATTTTTQFHYPALAKRAILWYDAAVKECEERHTRREKAALVLQCAWRCAGARIEHFNRRQIFLHAVYSYQSVQVACIQRAYRLYRYRRDLRIRITHRHKKHENRATAERALDRNVRKIAAWWYRYRSRKQKLLNVLTCTGVISLKRSAAEQQYIEAARKLARWWRTTFVINKCINRCIQDYQQEVLLKRARKQQQRELAACRTLQRVGVGLTTRLYVAYLFGCADRAERHRIACFPSAIDIIRIHLTQISKRRTRLSREATWRTEARHAAARCIAKAWRHSLVYPATFQRKAAERRQRLRWAVHMLQRFFRRTLARREGRIRRRRAYVMAHARITSEWKRDRAAATLQRTVRRCIVAPKAVRRRRAALGRWAIANLWVVQRVGHGFLERKRLKQKTDSDLRAARDAIIAEERRRTVAATRIQKITRGIQGRAKATRAAASRAAEKALIARMLTIAILQERSAVVIQRHARTLLVQILVRNWRAIIDPAATKIQSLVRGCQARKRFETMLQEDRKRRERRDVYTAVRYEVNLYYLNEMVRMEVQHRMCIELDEEEGWAEDVLPHLVHPVVMSSPPGAVVESTTPREPTPPAATPLPEVEARVVMPSRSPSPPVITAEPPTPAGDVLCIEEARAPPTDPEPESKTPTLPTTRRRSLRNSYPCLRILQRIRDQEGDPVSNTPKEPYLALVYYLARSIHEEPEERALASIPFVSLRAVTEIDDDIADDEETEFGQPGPPPTSAPPPNEELAQTEAQKRRAEKIAELQAMQERARVTVWTSARTIQKAVRLWIAQRRLSERRIKIQQVVERRVEVERCADEESQKLLVAYQRAETEARKQLEGAQMIQRSYRRCRGLRLHKVLIARNQEAQRQRVLTENERRRVLALRDAEVTAAVAAEKAIDFFRPSAAQCIQRVYRRWKAMRVFQGERMRMQDKNATRARQEFRLYQQIVAACVIRQSYVRWSRRQDTHSRYEAWRQMLHFMATATFLQAVWKGYSVRRKATRGK